MNPKIGEEEIVWKGKRKIQLAADDQVSPQHATKANCKVDNVGAFGSKRSHNDGSQNDGVWTCPNCGNDNFGFRTVCNRSKCGAPRPPVTMAPPITSHYHQPPPFYFGGIGIPPPMPFGVTGRYGPPIPLSVARYDYGPPGSAHGPYALLPPLLPGFLGGMGYGSGPAIDGYGYGFQESFWAVGGIPDNTASWKHRGGTDGLYEVDWICHKCGNVNFVFRTTCNIKECRAPRPPGPNQTNAGIPGTCSKCGNLNYPFRLVCNQKSCGHDKPA